MPPTTHQNRILEINGGTVAGQQGQDGLVRLGIPAEPDGYTNAQIDDYGGKRRRDYPWQAGAGVCLSLRARFSHPADQLAGTAGFGFWNAPFGDPTTPWPTLPQATWFFLAGRPNNLPLNPHGPGQDFFASTLDATTWRALRLAPLAPPVVLLNRIHSFKEKFWPKVQHQLGMSYQQIDQIDLTKWQTYKIHWKKSGCTFIINGEIVLETTQSPRGPLGFVCWIDNQFMQVTPTGRVQAGVTPLKQDQWLEIDQLSLKSHET